MAQPNNDFQFLDIERVDPPKRDMKRRVGEFVEIYVCNFENSKVQNWQFSIL